MSDEERRSAERRWRETGAPEDGRRYLTFLTRAGEEVEALRVRVAIGALHPGRLELAAHVGHAPAQAALGRADGPLSLADWATRLHDLGRQPACVRAALAAARVALAGHEAHEAEADAARALQAAETWLGCPCVTHYNEAQEFNRLRQRLPAWAWQTVTSAHCPPRACWHHRDAIVEAAAATSEAAVRAAVRDALVAWALPAEGGEPSLTPADGHPR